MEEEGFTRRSILSNIEPQLGLRLEAGKEMIDHVVIDHLQLPGED